MQFLKFVTFSTEGISANNTITIPLEQRVCPTRMKDAASSQISAISS